MLIATNGPFRGPTLVVDKDGLYQVKDDGCSIPHPRLFNCLFERMPNGSYRERAVPLEPVHISMRFICGGDWDSKPKTLEEELRNMRRSSTFGYDTMSQYPLGQRLALP